MNKRTIKILSFTFFAIFILGSPLFAQTNAAGTTKSQKFENESDLYYYNTAILKIASHKLGYYVMYKKNNLKSGEFFIPKAWFSRQDGRAFFETASTNIRPYISVYYKNGEFDHIKIVVAKDLRHSTWGQLQVGSAYDDKFNTETLKLEF